MDIYGYALFDIVIVAIIVACAIEGIFKGFVVTVLSFFSYILAIVVAKLYYPKLSFFLQHSENLFLDIKNAIRSHVFTSVQSGMGTEQIVNSYPLPNVMQHQAVNQINQSVTTSIADGVSAGVIGLFYDIISFILIFLLVRAVIYLAIKLLNIIAKLPVLKQVNGLGGLIAGTIKGILVVYVVCIVITPWVGFKSQGFIAENLAHSQLALMFYKNNVIWNFVKGVQFLSLG